MQPLRARLQRLGGTLVAVHVYGAGLEDFENWSLQVLQEVYQAADGEAPGLAELHLYPDRATMEAVLALEARRAGVIVDASYLAMHEAWTGIPRIHASLELLRYSSIQARSLLGHEAVHSVLHGGLEYYVLELPTASRLGAVAAQVAATAVKDLEVHEWSRRRGLSWLLAGQREYWSPVLPKLACNSVEELGDALRASTAWLVEGMEPPLSPQCRRHLEALWEALTRLLEEWRRGAERPWSRASTVAQLVLEALEELEAEA